MNRIAAVIAGLSLAFVGTSTTIAGTINVPGDYALIQDAINASVSGDVINIAAGTYYEHDLNPNGKAITIQGTLNGDGSLATTIDGNQQGSVIHIPNGNGLEFTIRNLVITGGTGSDNSDIGFGPHGGGMLLVECSPRIEGCRIVSNSTLQGIGAGIHVRNGNPTITDCEFSSNIALYRRGGGIALYHCNASISNCRIFDNSSDSGSGILLSNTNCTLMNVEIFENESYYSGGGVQTSWAGNLVISGGSICGNTPDQIDNFNPDEFAVTSGLCWMDDNCDANPYTIISDQQEKIDQLLTMNTELMDLHVQQQSAIEDLQQVVTACCATQSCAGDENNDGVVNIADLLIIIDAWGPCP